MLLGYTEENGTNGIIQTISCKDNFSSPQSPSYPVAEEMVGHSTSRVEPTLELTPQSNLAPHHNEHTDLLSSLFNEHQLNDPIDPFGMHSPLTELDQEWDYNWSSLLSDVYSVTDPVCY